MSYLFIESAIQKGSIKIAFFNPILKDSKTVSNSVWILRLSLTVAFPAEYFFEKS